MSESNDEDSATRNDQGSLAQAADVARRLRKREYNRRYRERHPEKNAAIRRRWVEANRDRIRESNRRWRADNIERARQLNRDAARRAALRRQSDVEQRVLARARAKEWRESHLDEVRGYHAQWVARNSEKIREYSVRYYEAHRGEINERAAARRDANPEIAKRWRKAWAERNKERLADLQRERRKNPDVYQSQLEANADARRLRRRLQNSGLPPKQLHPVAAAERRAHEKAAQLYFSDPLLAEHVRQSAVFTETLTEHLRHHEPQMREFAAAYIASRLRQGLPPADAEEVMYCRAVDVALGTLQRTDLLSSRDIAGAVRSSRALLRQERRNRQFDRLLRAVVVHVNSQQHRLDRDVEMENRARAKRGLPRVRTDALLVQLALREVVERVPIDQLSTVDIRAICRSARARVLTPSDADLRASSPISVGQPRSKKTLP
ncbi:hypothetical protein [Conyzicola sp.]|uniref:hypothetical protein n=1 Tax=Conyzicola sp. TaxID=1969404 RepID=UPI003988DEEE